MLDVEGAGIEVLEWGRRSAPGLLLFHGSRASADWWSIIAPLLMRDYHVVAFSTSGMGGSDRRPAYSLTHFAREALAVADAFGLFESGLKPIFVAHSFGGYAALRACTIDGDRIGGVVLVDVLLQSLTLSEQPWKTSQPEPVRTYGTLAEALSRFRLIPSRPTNSLWALDEIARRSLRQIPATGDWTWQFDNALFSRLSLEDLSNFHDIRTPVAIVRGEHSELYDGRVKDRVADIFGVNIPDVVIPESGHHIMVDQPLALATSLRTLLAAWPYRPGTDRRSNLGTREYLDL